MERKLFVVALLLLVVLPMNATAGFGDSNISGRVTPGWACSKNYWPPQWSGATVKVSCRYPGGGLTKYATTQDSGRFAVALPSYVVSPYSYCQVQAKGRYGIAGSAVYFVAPPPVGQYARVYPRLDYYCNQSPGCF